MELEDFETGPAINEAVVAWLDANAKGRTVQLPVEIHGSPLRIKASYLRADSTRIEIHLDTGALSIDLAMHLKPHCNAYPCWVWLQGTWGPLVPGVNNKTLPVFAVRSVAGVAGPDATHVRILR